MASRSLHANIHWVFMLIAAGLKILSCSQLISLDDVTVVRLSLVCRISLTFVSALSYHAAC